MNTLNIILMACTLEMLTSTPYLSQQDKIFLVTVQLDAQIPFSVFIYL